MIRYVLAKRGEGGHFSISFGRTTSSLAQLVESVRDEAHVSRVPSPRSRFDEMRDVFCCAAALTIPGSGQLAVEMLP